MIPGLCCFASRGVNNGSSFREVINEIGLTSGLKLLLDAGDRESVASASQTKWLDVSGNGYDFNRGSGSGSDSADPTFNGTIGRQSSGEYYSSDGGDYFSYDASNETWMDNLHKNNAVFSFAGWWWLTASNNLFATGATPVDIGIRFVYSSTSDRIEFDCNAGTGSAAADLNVSLSDLPTSTWVFVAGAYTESTGSLSVSVNGQTGTASGTYTSPSSASATFALRIAWVATNGTRLANFAMWEGTALSSAQQQRLFQETRGKFGV